MSAPADTWSENGRRGGGGEAEAGRFAREARAGAGSCPCGAKGGQDGAPSPRERHESAPWEMLRGRHGGRRTARERRESTEGRHRTR